MVENDDSNEVKFVKIRRKLHDSCAIRSCASANASANIVRIVSYAKVLHFSLLTHCDIDTGVTK